MDAPTRTPRTSRADIAGIIDHTLLRPEATTTDIAATCHEAITLRTHAVCVSPSMLPTARTELAGHPVGLVAVVGFPSGAHAPQIKAAEAAAAVAAGATEVDMVINLGAAMDNQWDAIAAEIQLVRESAPHPTLLKVIIETALIGEKRIPPACHAAEQAGADLVKTSTGFHPAGGATPQAVELMAAAVSPHLRIKAAGGIRTLDQAITLINAGATRLGTSHTRDILACL